ncbi:hypothetical protein [Pseudomonas sp. ADAK18]|uniref:hypothetical protein n=1 Tax=Pseudomonas sp. ADAK18 TaxID=2730848 RepID=UPI00191F4956|nr:hypothetical protein [Pseudomonas sp. ADAK18]
MPIDDGGSAFPATEANYHNENMRGEGMSLRDYFAAKAVSGLIAGSMADGSTWEDGAAELVAEAAYRAADAMLAARSA